MGKPIPKDAMDKITLFEKMRVGDYINEITDTKRKIWIVKGAPMYKRTFAA